MAPTGKTLARRARARLFDDEARHGRVVVDGVGVGHRADGGEAARDGRGRARRDGLLVLLPRLAQVCVQVYEAGRDDEASGVEDLRALGRVPTAAKQFGHAPIFDQDVASTVHTLRRVYDVAVGDKQSHLFTGSAVLSGSGAASASAFVCNGGTVVTPAPPPSR